MGDTLLLAGLAAAVDRDVCLCLPTKQVNAPPDAQIRAFLTRNILPVEEEPAVLRLAHCVELRTIVHRDTVEVYVDDFQHTQLELSELILRVGYFFHFKFLACLSSSCYLCTC